MEYSIRRARAGDVRAIAALVSANVESRRLLGKADVTLYEDVQEFWVAQREQGGAVAGCGALHVMWRDLAEVRTIAVSPEFRGRGVGHAILEKLLATAGWLGIRRVFCLTFETRFFAAHGFTEHAVAAVDPSVEAELLRSADEGIAEFLDLERVKPNTLGNTRMLKLL